MENKRKDVEEKEKALAELDRQLKKRKEQMDQMEASLRKVSLKYIMLNNIQDIFSGFSHVIETYAGETTGRRKYFI